MTASSQPRLTAVDAGLLVLVAFIWGFNFVVIALGLNDFPPLLFTALRFAACGFLVFLVPRPQMSWPQLIVVGVTLGTLVFAFLFTGIHAGMPAGLASVVMQMQVFFTVLLGVVLLGERPAFMNWLAVIVGGAGITLIAVERLALGNWTAFALVLAGAFSWGVANIVLKKLPRANMLHLMIWMSLIPPLPLLALSLAVEGWPAIRPALLDVSWSGVGAVLYTGLLSTIVAYAIWGNMLQRHQTSAVAPFALLTPVFGLLSAYVFLNERHSLSEGMASFLIVIALAINFRAAALQDYLQKTMARLRPGPARE